MTLNNSLLKATKETVWQLIQSIAITTRLDPLFLVEKILDYIETLLIRIVLKRTVY